MKKVLSLFLVLCMCLSISTITFAEETKDVVEGEAYIYAEKLLSDLGVYEGVEAFSAADGFVKKDIFAIIITRLMKMENCVGTGFDVELIDVKPDDFAANEILTLMSMGVLDIPADGYFRPGKYITYKEAAKALIQVLGYDIAVTNKTFDGYLSQARDIGILKHVSFSKDERLQVKQLPLMLYNSLFIDSMGMSFTGGGQTYSISKGDTLLLNNFNLIEINGVVTANSITNLNFGGELSSGNVNIDNVTYDVGQTNAEDLIGYKVRAYYDKDTETLVSIDSTIYTEEFRLSIEDLEYKNQAYTYYVNNRKKTSKISSKADIIYNHEAMVFDKTLMVPHEGEVLLLDHDSDSTYDTVIITSSEARVVQEYTKSQNSIAFKYSGGSINFDDYDEDKIVVLKEDGTEGKLTSLVEWSVVNVCESLSGKFIELTISNTKVTGDVENIDNSDGKSLVTIDGKEYEISYYYPNKDKNEILLGTTGTFYLDKYGKIAGVSFQESVWYYGYLMKAAYTDEHFEEAYMFKIFSEESGGTLKIYQTAKKVRIDNTSCNRDGKTKQGVDLVQGKLMTPQLIRYKTNSQAEIIHIDTEDTPVDELGLRIDVANGNRKYRGNQFVGEISINSATKVFVIPDAGRNPNPDDPDDAELYMFKNASWLVADGYYNVTSYVIDKESLIADAIVVKRKKEAANLNAFLVEDIHVVYDDSRDEVLDKITGRLGTATYEYLAPQGFADNNDINEGDIIAIGAAPNGLIEIVSKIYDYKTDKVVSQYGSVNYDAQIKVLEGYAYNKQSGVVQVSTDSTSLSGPKKVPVGSTAVVVYDSKAYRNPVSVGTVKDISDYTYYYEADRIICILNYQVLKSVFVYKK